MWRSWSFSYAVLLCYTYVGDDQVVRTSVQCAWVLEENPFVLVGVWLNSGQDNDSRVQCRHCVGVRVKIWSISGNYLVWNRDTSVKCPRGKCPIWNTKPQMVEGKKGNMNTVQNIFVYGGYETKLSFPWKGTKHFPGLSKGVRNILHQKRKNHPTGYAG